MLFIVCWKQIPSNTWNIDWGWLY